LRQQKKITSFFSTVGTNDNIKEGLEASTCNNEGFGGRNENSDKGNEVATENAIISTLKSV